jgi:hypothetical protein
MNNNQIIVIDEIKANSLPELQGWKEKQEALVEENPFLPITDHKSYEEGKKRRTALLKGRTEIEKQDKLVASKLRELRGKISEASKELISISLPHETKQQEEVKRYEEKKAEEKAEKERIEAERKQGIKDSIESIFQEWKKAINNLTYEGIEDFLMVDILADADTSKFEEFELDFAEKVQTLTTLFNEKKGQLEIAEKQRLEDERLKKERESLEEEKRQAREKAEKEAEEKRLEQEKIDAENEKKAKELAKKEAEIEEEKKRLAKKEAEVKAKEEAEKAAKEKAEKEAEEKAQEEAAKKREEALQPDKKKLQKVIDSISINAEKPNLKDGEAVEFYNKLEQEIQALKENLSNCLSNLK